MKQRQQRRGLSTRDQDKMDGPPPPTLRWRVMVGGFSAVIALMVVHQGAWQLLHIMDLPELGMPSAWPTDRIPPFNVPSIINLCFWAGLWGAGFAILWRGPRGSFIQGGVWLGIVSVLVAFFVVDPLKGLNPAVTVHQLNIWLRRLFMNVPWGIATALLASRYLADHARRDEYSE